MPQRVPDVWAWWRTYLSPTGPKPVMRLVLDGHMRRMDHDGKGCWAGVRDLARITGLNKDTIAEHRALALAVNYPSLAAQRACLARHAPNALAVGGVVFAAGVLVGVLTGTGMVDAMARSVLEVLDAVDRVAATSIRRTVEPRRAGDPDALVADNRAILARLDWKPMLDNLDTIVSHALAWERQLDERRAAA